MQVWRLIIRSEKMLDDMKRFEARNSFLRNVCFDPERIQ